MFVVGVAEHAEVAQGCLLGVAEGFVVVGAYSLDGCVAACGFALASWASTQQGGFNANLDLRPHLRIINASENQRSGAELGQFYSAPRENVPIACGVENGQFFMTLPLTALILSTIEDRPVVDDGAMIDRESSFSSVRSVSMCFGSDN